MSQPTAAELVQRIERRDYAVGIVGLGYVGIPLALTACRAGFRVVGFDIDENHVARINRGDCVISHIPTEAMIEATADGRFVATADFDRIAEVDAVLIAVPTPLSRQREPDLSFVERTVEAIAPRLKPGHLVVLESTTWPGTTAEIVAPRLEATGLKLGADFFLAFSPEREDPGNRDFATATIPKVVGADDPGSLLVAESLYGALVSRTVPVSSAATAEAVKLTENIFRAVNVALVNELKVIYGRMGIDVWEVIEAAKTKPFGFMPFYPGPGLGGHCVPIDPFYLTWKAREFGVATRFVELAGEVNQAMPGYVVDRLAEALDRAQAKGLNGSRVLVVGLAYKKNVEDTRESPSLRMIDLLERRGATVSFHDPFVPEIGRIRAHPALAGRRSVPLDAETVAGFDAVLIATDHDAVDYGALTAAARLVVDTRNACERAGVTSPNVVKA